MTKKGERYGKAKIKKCCVVVHSLCIVVDVAYVLCIPHSEQWRKYKQNNHTENRNESEDSLDYSDYDAVYKNLDEQ